jgi:hypothetical protein
VVNLLGRRKLGSFCAIGRPLPAASPGIGFVSHDLPSRERRTPDRHKGRNWLCLYNTPRPPGHSGGNWVCLAHLTVPVPPRLPQIGFVPHFRLRTSSQLGLFGKIIHHRDIEGMENEAGHVCGCGDGASALPYVFTSLGSAFKSSISNHKSLIRGSVSDRSVPLSRGRVARIVPKFRAQPRPRNRVTPGAGRSKEFLARGVFCLFNCCTNHAGRAGGGRP